MRRFLAVTAITFMFSALFFVGVCTAGDGIGNSRSAASPARPFKGTLSGNMYVVGYCTDGSLLIQDVGKGIFSHVGAGELSATVCWYPNADNPTEAEGEGHAVLTGANGDAIYVSIILKSYGLGSSSGTWYQTETITGGTGRFAGATGASTSNGTWTVATETSFTWEGTQEGDIEY